MSLTSAPLIAPSGTDGFHGIARSESVYFARRRVSLTVAALFFLLVCGRAPHFHYLLAHWSGGHAAGIALLGNALLVGVYAFIATVAAMNAILGFPRLTVTPQGLMRRSLFRTTTVEWNSLSRFHVAHVNGGKAASAAADIIGPDASPRLRRGKRKLFKITATYRTPVETIVAEIHDRQTEALGVPAPLPRAASAPVVPEYGVAGFRMPWATFGLLAILTAVFVAEHRLGVAPEAAPLTPDLLTLYAFGGLSWNAVLNHAELLRLFSSALLHLSAAHLIGNAVALLLVGWPLERLVGRPWVLAIFVVSGLAGSIMGLVAYPANMVIVGASGGIAGLFGAMVVLSFRLPTLRKRTFMVLGTTLAMIAMFIPLKTQGNIQIGHAVHIAGALAGAALGMFLLRTWLERSRLPRFRRAGLAVGAGGLAMALVGVPTSLGVSRASIAMIQGCAESSPDTRVRSCTALLDSDAGNRLTTLLNRGNAYLEKAQYDLAIVDFDRLIELAPGSAYARVSRGVAYARKGLRDRSIPDFTKAIELAPKLSLAYFYRGGDYLDEGLVDLAIADEDQAIALNPSLAGAYAIRGQAYSRNGGTEAAIKDYSKAIALDPGDAATYYGRGVAYLRANRFDEAIGDNSKALELRPEDAAAYNNRAWALHLKGENALALPDAEKAVTLAPGSVSGLETRAEIYEKLGRTSDAATEYRAVLAIDGGQQLARDGLMRSNAKLRKSL